MKFNSNTRPVVIDESISVTGNLLTVNGKTISLTDVTGFRYGYATIRLELHSIGSSYSVELQTPHLDLRLNFRTYFGINKKKQFGKFAALMDALWDPIVTRLIDEMSEKLERGETVKIGKCEVTCDGILYKNFLITWDDLSYQKNYNRLTINSRSNRKVWTNLYFLDTFNVDVLMHFLDARYESCEVNASA